MTKTHRSEPHQQLKSQQQLAQLQGRIGFVSARDETPVCMHSRGRAKAASPTTRHRRLLMSKTPRQSVREPRESTLGGYGTREDTALEKKQNIQESWNRTRPPQ